jgi:protein TonB
MEIKKYPNAVLENYSKILVQLGLVLSLFLVYEFISMKTYPVEVEGLTSSYVVIEDSEQIVEVKAIPPVETPAPKSAVPDKILVVQDDLEVEEAILESTETDESEAVEVEVVEELETVEEEEEVVEDVPFLVIEEAPVFPGCSGTKKELKSCFSDKIAEFVKKRFNSTIASNIGLEVGSIQKIFVMFTVDSKGEITDIRARAPHKVLQNEAIRVISLLPQMTPGKQRGKPVGVKYALPITFKVE